MAAIPKLIKTRGSSSKRVQDSSSLPNHVFLLLSAPFPHYYRLQPFFLCVSCFILSCVLRCGRMRREIQWVVVEEWKRETRTLDITVSVTGAWEGKLNKRRKEVKVQNREETDDESDKSPSEKDVRVFNGHSSLIEPYHFYLPSLSANTIVCRSLGTLGD